MFVNNKSIILKRFNEDKNEYILYISDKKECADISKGLVTSTEEIVAFGESNTMDIVTAENILPPPGMITSVITNSIESSYKCWCCENLGIEQLAAHKTSLNSWDCLMVRLGNPSHVVITQRKVKDNGEVV